MSPGKLFLALSTHIVLSFLLRKVFGDFTDKYISVYFLNFCFVFIPVDRFWMIAMRVEHEDSLVTLSTALTALFVSMNLFQHDSVLSII